MAVTIVVRGLVTVAVDADSGGGLETLGYTRNGAEITSESFMLDVPGDENGGDDGPPVDIQYLGEIARVRLELTKFDSDVAAKIEARLKDGTFGVIPLPGQLIMAGQAYMRLLLNTPTGPRNYLRAIPRMPIEHNVGTKYTTLMVEFECHAPAGGGVMFSADISG